VLHCLQIICNLVVSKGKLGQRRWHFGWLALEIVKRVCKQFDQSHAFATEQ